MGRITIIIWLVLLTLLGIAVWMLYLTLPGEKVNFLPTDISPGVTLDDDLTRVESEQFYERMRFTDRKISYRIEETCSDEKAREMREAFDIFESSTVLEFYSSNDAQIVIECSNLAPDPEFANHFVAGEGGPTEVINNTLYAVILSGKISFFRDEECSEPKIATHELLHVLGFNHNDDPNSILYPTLNCNQEIDDYLIDDINELYEADSNPDLKIERVNATKSGPYLKFEISVKNQGLAGAENAALRVYADNKEVKDFDLNSIEVGTSKILTVENVRVSRFAKELSFVVDPDNEIEEIFENNNRLDLILAN